MERAGELGGAALSLAPYAGIAMMVERTCAYGLSRSGFGSISNSLYTAQAARQEALVAGERSYARMETTAVLERATLAEETTVSGRSSLGTATQTLEKEALAEVEEVGAATKPSQASNALVQAMGKEHSLDSLSRAGLAMDRNGLTRAGRALDKHGGRPGSVFPRATGNLTTKNAQGQFQLDDILTHPQGYSKLNGFGGVDYYRPNGSGARFYNNGEFRGFLEPDL